MYNGIHVSTEHCINLCLFYLICYRYKKNCFELKCFVCSCKIRWTWSTICYTVQSNRWPIQLQSRVGNVAIQECRQQAIMVISCSCLTCIALVQIVFRSMFIWQRLNFKKNVNLYCRLCSFLWELVLSRINSLSSVLTGFGGKQGKEGKRRWGAKKNCGKNPIKTISYSVRQW